MRVVPVVRRLYEKGLPLSIGIAFLLAAPVVNPVVILSTYSAFGWGPVLWGRLLFSFLIAVGVGYLFSRAQPDEVLLPEIYAAHQAACCSVRTPTAEKRRPHPVACHAPFPWQATTSWIWSATSSSAACWRRACRLSFPRRHCSPWDRGP